MENISTKLLVTLLILSVLIIFVGAIAKLQHFAWAGTALSIGAIAQGFALVIVILLMYKKYRSNQK